MAILEERGLFWWADDPIPEHQFAPNSCVSGLLRIDDDGSSSLELDSYLPSKHGPMAAMAERELPPETCIRGLLKGSAQHVCLVGLIRNGGQMRTKGISYERYRSSACLLSERDVIVGRLNFKKFSIPLTGYGDWLRLRALKVKKSSRTVSVNYTRPKDAKYVLSHGSLAIEFELGGVFSGGIFAPEASMKETASASFWFRHGLDIDGIRKEYQLFEDLLVMLTSSTCGLDWPWVIGQKGRRYRLYLSKVGGRTVGKPPSYFDCITNFIQIRDTFASIWETWRSKREDPGPALYFYLVTRRGLPLYLEHRFVSLVWGIEVFHRKEPVREHIESSESFVIQGKRPDSIWGAADVDEQESQTL